MRELPVVPLVKFLKEQEILEKFIKNFEKHQLKCDESEKISLEGFLIDDNLGMMAAFFWDETPEGHDYWSALKIMFDKQEENLCRET